MSTGTLPESMKALFQASAESKELILTTLPVPVSNTNENECLIRVHTVSPCAGELLWPKYFPPPQPNSKTLVPCYDVAGTIVTAPESSQFKVGDEVYCRTNYIRTGCAAEYAIVVTEELSLKPKTLTWVETATVALSAETAWQALFVQGGLSPVEGTGAKGKRVLVTAASGGVGVWVVQLAKWAGADVVGTCGPDNIELVSSLGAKEVLNYRTADLKDWAKDEKKKVDLVIDCVGGASLESAWWVVKNDGTLISIYQPPEQKRPAELSESKAKNFFFIMESDGSQLQIITNIIDEGKARPLVDSVWPLEEFERAFERLDSGHSKGKVVIEIGK